MASGLKDVDGNGRGRLDIENDKGKFIAQEMESEHVEVASDMVLSSGN